MAVLKHELQALNITEPLKTIYIGGGTPSSLNDEQLEWLMDIIKPYISSETKEVSIEVNPESIDYYKLDILKRGGVSRLSIGVETLIASIRVYKLSGLSIMHAKLVLIIFQLILCMVCLIKRLRI